MMKESVPPRYQSRTTRRRKRICSYAHSRLGVVELPSRIRVPKIRRTGRGTRWVCLLSYSCQFPESLVRTRFERWSEPGHTLGDTGATDEGGFVSLSVDGAGESTAAFIEAIVETLCLPLGQFTFF